MTVSSINGISFGNLSHVDGVSLTGLSHINGQQIAAGSPDNIAGLAMWVRGDSTGVSDGNEVTTWSDLSGNNNFCTGVGATKPILRSTGGPNSQPCVEFSGSASYFTVPTFYGSYTSAHAFVVIKVDTDPPGVGSVTGPPFGHFGNAASELASAYPFTDSVVYENFGTTVRKTCGDPTPSLASWRLYEIRTASAAWSNYIDGAQLFSTGTNTVGWRASGFLGHDVTGTTHNYLDGRIADAFIYDHVLSAGQISSIYSYVNSRYGITF